MLLPLVIITYLHFGLLSKFWPINRYRYNPEFGVRIFLVNLYADIYGTCKDDFHQRMWGTCLNLFGQVLFQDLLLVLFYSVLEFTERY